ncbi:hypothetical protein MAA_11827 [Metarhizium robertsii ARSEF 23]|uniref:Uncharacterized protein n=1 Tax=Metarhizium robertsii (strain ARSEF 23 / ATCC MYA-3075) TaxID=655844 RepID=A0A0B2XG91_METRA|nr:uncharacterized protein MAA_11827 [Metarhizium robertsii ARSEF 23]KHO10572.1 hypothetical protein MAA_11827 [Metarhizium robertsii ARSEF 23]
MVRPSFIISLALAAQGLQAAPSKPRDQLEPLAVDAQDAEIGYPVQLDRQAGVDAGSSDGCQPDNVNKGTKGDNTAKRPIPTGYPTQDEEKKFQKDRQRGKTKHKDAEAQRAKEKADQDAAREAAKKAAIEKDAKDAEERKKKAEREKAFKEVEKESERKEATGNQNTNTNAQKIVDDGQKNCKEGGPEIGCNKPLPTKSQAATN